MVDSLYVEQRGSEQNINTGLEEENLKCLTELPCPWGKNDGLYSMQIHRLILDGNEMVPKGVVKQCSLTLSLSLPHSSILSAVHRLLPCLIPCLLFGFLHSPENSDGNLFPSFIYRIRKFPAGIWAWVFLPWVNGYHLHCCFSFNTHLSLTGWITLDAI